MPTITEEKGEARPVKYASPLPSFGLTEALMYSYCMTEGSELLGLGVVWEKELYDTAHLTAGMV